MTTPRSYLWQLPPDGLIYKEGAWHATADRSLGKALGLLVPVRDAGANGWDVAAEADVLFRLQPVEVDTPTPLAPPAGSPASDYLCLLRYDHPEDRPGSTFSTDFQLASLLKDRIPRQAVEKKAADQVSVQELRAGLQLAWRQFGQDIARYVISAAPAGQAAVARQAAAPAAAARPAHLTFAFASCQYPAGMMDRQQANASYRAIARAFPRGSPPTRLLLLGDQVYTDATYGLLDPARLDDRFRMPYEELTARTGPLGQLPQDFRRVIRMTPDDHELVDDWEPWGPGATGERHRRGVAAYWRYQRGETAPADPVWIVEPAPGDPQQGWRLFMTDTRTTRQYRNERNILTASLLDRENDRKQAGALRAWILDAPDEDLKIVTSAAMLLPRTRMYIDEPLYLDNWQGYPASLHWLLALLCEREVRNIVFLSGDAHLACSARIQVSNPANGKRVEFDSHHAPALYAPFPFANESRWNLLLRDRFSFEHEGTRYDCRVAARAADARAHGCGVLEARRDGGEWKLKARLLAAKTD